MRDLPSLNALRVFEAAARLKSFKRAAEELRVTQSGVSRQIQTLEKQLGVRLFRRLGRGVEISQAGATLSPVLTRALDDIADVTGKLSQSRDAAGAAATLVISATPGIAELWLGSHLGRFCRAHPAIDPEITISRDLEPLYSGIVDVAIYYGAGDWPNLEHEVLRDLVEFPVCSPLVLESGPPLRKPEDLRHHRLIHWKSRSSWGTWLREFGVGDVNWNVGPVLHDYSMYLEMATFGEGVALADDLMAAGHLYAGSLVKPLVEIRVQDRQHHLLIRPNRSRAQLVKAFRDWIVAEIREDQRNTADLRRRQPFMRASRSRCDPSSGSQGSTAVSTTDRLIKLDSSIISPRSSSPDS